MYDRKSILITGGTGSFGQAFTEYLLTNFQPERIVIYSRDEMKQWSMQNKFKGQNTLRFFVGDVRDKERLQMAMRGIDLVVHAAAMKIVPVAEYNPFECVKTNVIGAMNVVEAALFCGVTSVVALSTDKASSPTNLYGATKLTSDKVFIASNSYSGSGGTIFSVVRYGNVLGSRGSVIPFFMGLPDDEDTPITHPDMTRFFITLNEGINLVTEAFTSAIGGEIFVKKIPSIKITDLARVLRPKNKIKFVGVRPGEKLHEQMISVEDSEYTYEYDQFYKILPAINDWEKDIKRIGEGKKVHENFSYSSDKNSDWIDDNTVKEWLETKFETLSKY